MYKKILFPTDGSGQANRALDYVIDIAGKFNAEVTVLYTYEVSDEVTRLVAKLDKGISRQLEDMGQHLKSYGEEITSESVKRLQEKGIKTNLVIENNVPGEAIVNHGKTEGYDLIVMGSRGLGKIKSLLLGSTSSHVIHHSDCPVILIH